MKQIKLSDSLAIQPEVYATQANAFLGIRDSGKSYDTTMFAEQLHERGIPFTAFDPSGVWRYLKVPGRGEGIPVVVIGGARRMLEVIAEAYPESLTAEQVGEAAEISPSSGRSNW